MGIIRIDKREYLSEDKSHAVVCQIIKLFGIPLYTNTYATESLSVLSYFDQERYDAMSEEESDLYKKTQIGFKSNQN